MTSVQELNNGWDTSHGTQVCNVSTTLSPGVCVFWRFAQPFYNITLSMFLYLVTVVFDGIKLCI